MEKTQSQIQVARTSVWWFLDSRNLHLFIGTLKNPFLLGPPQHSRMPSPSAQSMQLFVHEIWRECQRSVEIRQVQAKDSHSNWVYHKTLRLHHRLHEVWFSFCLLLSLFWGNVLLSAAFNQFNNTIVQLFLDYNARRLKQLFLVAIPRTRIDAKFLSRPHQPPTFVQAVDQVI